MNCTHVTLAVIHKEKNNEKIKTQKHIIIRRNICSKKQVFIKIKHAYRCVEKIGSYSFKSNISISI